jgi:hypothetical protein
MNAQVKYRNMWGQVGLMVITIGFYAIYWFYQTCTEMKGLANDEQASPTLWTVLLFIPFGCIYSYYKHGELYEKIASDKLNRWIIFILWIVFSPATWFIVQMELNNKATYNKPGQANYPPQSNSGSDPKQING